jgi:hypothetical protein
MVTVTAKSQGGSWLCEVIVDQAGRRGRHRVTVTPSDVARWAGGDQPADVERLVARSFDFLLERESPQSILATFDLSVIPRYFPEYDRAFRRQ